jgi:uncharacterized membrane protein
VTGSSLRPGKRRREGSRALLAVALAAGVAAALFVGARVSDLISDLAGIDSPTVRLGLKVACVVVALPAGFYLVERLFLGRASRRNGQR